MAANLRHHDIEPVFNEQTLADGLADFPFRDELKRLWELATVLRRPARQAARRRSSARTTTSSSTGSADRRMAPAASRSTNARAAARSTSWSPN